MSEDFYPSLDTILQNHNILINLAFLEKSFSLLNVDNTREYDTMKIMGNASSLSIDNLYIILLKISELNAVKSTRANVTITKLVMVFLNFGSFDSLSLTHFKISRFPKNSGLKQITFENCWCLFYLIPILISTEEKEKESELGFNGIESLTHLNMVSYDSNETIRKLSERLENNYTIRSIIPDLSGFSPHEKHTSVNKITEYIKRNKQGYDKYISVILTMLTIRKHRKSRLNLMDKDSILIICKMISETKGTYIWLDKLISDNTHTRIQ